MKRPKYAIYGERCWNQDGTRSRDRWWVVWHAGEGGMALGDPERTYVCLPDSRHAAETTAALLNDFYGRIEPAGLIPPRPMNYGNEWYRRLIHIAGNRIQELQATGGLASWTPAGQHYIQAAQRVESRDD